MRGLSPLFNILLTCLAAGAMVPALTLPWFGGAVDSNDGNQGQVELMGEAIGRWFSDSGTTATGGAVLGGIESAILGVALVTALLALLMLVPPMRATLRGTVKLVPLAAPVVVLAAILLEARAANVEPRYGAFVALALAIFLVCAAQQAGEMREKKSKAPKPYTPGAGRAF